jgi:Fur family transcriptional regulator, ferric uptake regulator
MTEIPNITYTNQRVEILNFLKDNFSHPTVEQVYSAVKKKLTRISKATVYQNLKFLAENGLVQEVNIKGISRFEPTIEPHHHIICKHCGKIIDFESKELIQYSLKKAKKLTQMNIESASTNFFGICKECTSKQ